MTRPPSDLEQALAVIIPGASLSVQTLPDVPELSLLLLDEHYPRQPLPTEVMQRIMDNPLYWVFCWASGQVLARFILDQPQSVSGKRVLDFGCGSGVVAIAAKMAGASEVIACDIDPQALEASAFNARLNNVELTLSDDFNAVSDALDLIVVADVLYDRENLGWLDIFERKADSVLVADSRVRNFDHPPYRRIAQMHSCTLPDLDESAEFRTVSIYST